MAALKDIGHRDDIHHLVEEFYKKVLADEALQSFFTEVAKIDVFEHMDKMVDFWEGVIFYKGSYKGNPMEAHQTLHKKKHLSGEHFQEWLTLFNTAVDQNFKGEKADLAKTRALSIATVMQIKLRDVEPK